MTPLERAAYLLEEMDRTHQERLQRGETGEWQTEANEIRRTLHALLAHLKPPAPKRFAVSREDWPTDY